MFKYSAVLPLSEAERFPVRAKSADEPESTRETFDGTARP